MKEKKSKIKWKLKRREDKIIKIVRQTEKQREWRENNEKWKIK